MADQKDKRRPRKRPARKPTAGQQALTDAQKRREDEERTRKNAESVRRAKGGQPELNPTNVDIYEQKARDEGYTDPEAIKYYAAKYRKEAEDARQPKTTKGQPPSGISLVQAADRVSSNARRLTAEQRSRALANPALYGAGVRGSDIVARLSAQKAALEDVRRNGAVTQLKKAGNAVYMGPKDAQVRRPIKGDNEFEGGQYRVPATVQIDNVVDRNQLMAWLADEDRFNQIKDRMVAAGIDVQSYDDVAKLWESVLKQASATFSLTGKKVTPWSLIQLRGKQMVDGKPERKTGTSTTIEEMDPAQARLLMEKAAQDWLGRAPTPEEIDHFADKAADIARANPLIQQWQQDVGFDGEAVPNSTEITHKQGGAEVVNAKAQVAAIDETRNSDESKKYRMAGVYMPELLDALRSVV